MAPTLGRLERVDLRDIWLSEAADFTPWLARSENLVVLAETLGLDLELEAQERRVGPFRADKRSAHTEISRIKALLRRPICHRTLALLSTSDLATYRDERLRSLSPSTVIRELNTISHAIDTAMRDWDIYLHRNPCKLVRRPSPPRGRNRRLRDDEEQRLLDAADSGRNLYMRDLIVLAIETGMRRGELLSLDWQHIDLDAQLAHLPLTKISGRSWISSAATCSARSMTSGNATRQPTMKRWLICTPACSSRQLGCRRWDYGA